MQKISSPPALFVVAGTLLTTGIALSQSHTTRSGPPSQGNENCPALMVESASHLADAGLPGNCLEASSTPVHGMLYPLSVDLFVDDTGQVGMGTLNPSATLDVQGDIWASNSVRAPVIAPGWGPATIPTFRFGDISEATGLASPLSHTLSITTDAKERGRFTSDGRFLMFDDGGQAAFELEPHSSGVNSIRLYGGNGNLNATLAGFDDPNRGFVGVQDASGVTQAYMAVDFNGDGIVVADVKNFVTDNPLDGETEIWYASLEGPEAAAYCRGTAMLIEGEAKIELPDYFSSIVTAESMTILLTPRSANTFGLAAVDRSTEHFTVRELAAGRHTFEFDWEVKAVRERFQDFEVVRPKRIEAIRTAPSAVTEQGR